MKKKWDIYKAQMVFKGVKTYNHFLYGDLLDLLPWFWH